MRKNEEEFVDDRLKSSSDSNSQDYQKDPNINSQYLSYLDKLVTLYYKVQPVLLTSLNDIFLQSNLEKLLGDDLLSHYSLLIKTDTYKKTIPLHLLLL